MKHQTSSRRRFLQTGSALAAGTLLPRAAFAVPANSKLRTAHIGVGGMGASDLASIASHASVEIAALCDVDHNRLQQANDKFPSATAFADYRELLSSLGDSIDAVVVSTPDHTHAPAAMSALNLDKPVYCQKPLTHSVYEARRLREAAERKSIVTQMGIQVHSTAPYRRAVAMIKSGIIGKVSEVHAWSNKSWGYIGGEFANVQPPPKSLEWDLWLGTASQREFVPEKYHPFQWRRLLDFGTGTLGDMGVHIFDTPYAALALTSPTWVRATCEKPTGIGHPVQCSVEFEFPGTDYTTDSLSWTWRDGGMATQTAADLGLDEEIQLPGQGSLLIGEEGTLLLPHVAEPVLYPAEKFSGVARPDVDDGNHYHQWVDACLGNGKTSASFSYGGPLTEALLLGVAAARFPGQTLHWDAAHMKVTNLPEANRLVRRTYRRGFEVDGLT